MNGKVIVGKIAFREADLENRNRDDIYFIASEDDGILRTYKTAANVGRLIGALCGEDYDKFVDFGNFEKIKQGHVDKGLLAILKKLDSSEMSQFEIGAYKGANEVKQNGEH